MRKIVLVMMIGLLTVFQLNSQKPVLIVESTLKLGPLKEEVFYYGFAAGDKLVFNFEEANNKELKEIEIIELPSTSRFKDFKTKKIENKTIDIANTGIYKFRFTNGTILPRVCKFSVQRIPVDASTQNFNTTVYTHTVSDTTYTTGVEEYIDRSDTMIITFPDRTIRIPAAAAGSNKSNFNFKLPEHTIGWSYYLFINEDGKKVYEDALKLVAAGTMTFKFQNYGPLAAEIYGAESHLKKLQSGLQINYWIVEGDNADLFMKGEPFKFIKKGTGANDYAKMDYRKGVLHFCFSNSVNAEAVNVTVKITSLYINEVLRTRPVQLIQSIKPKTEMYLKN
jgi:hypothetical protein